jgi:hypothetical protein
VARQNRKQQTERKEKSMNNKFDELTKQMAQSVTRRAALKKFGIGLAGMALACFGLVNKAGAATHAGYCGINSNFFNTYYTGMCMDINECIKAASPDCPAPGTSAGTFNKNGPKGYQQACGALYKSGGKCSFTI